MQPTSDAKTLCILYAAEGHRCDADMQTSIHLPTTYRTRTSTSIWGKAGNSCRVAHKTERDSPCSRPDQTSAYFATVACQLVTLPISLVHSWHHHRFWILQKHFRSSRTNRVSVSTVNPPQPPRTLSPTPVFYPLLAVSTCLRSILLRSSRQYTSSKVL